MGTGWSGRATWSSLLSGYRRAVAATRLVGTDPRVLCGATSYLGTGAATHLVGTDPRVLCGATSYLGTGGLLLLPIL
jgi:hypothetical protein